MLTSLPHLIKLPIQQPKEQVPLEDMPILSLNDLLEVWDNPFPDEERTNQAMYRQSAMYEKFKEKAKQKINQ